MSLLPSSPTRTGQVDRLLHDSRAGLAHSGGPSGDTNRDPGPTARIRWVATGLRSTTAPRLPEPSAQSVTFSVRTRSLTIPYGPGSSSADTSMRRESASRRRITRPSGAPASSVSGSISSLPASSHRHDLLAGVEVGQGERGVDLGLDALVPRHVELAPGGQGLHRGEGPVVVRPARRGGPGGGGSGAGCRPTRRRPGSRMHSVC